MSEQRECLVTVDILCIEIRLRHCQHQDALYKHQDRPYTTCTTGKHYGENACTDLAEIEIMDSEIPEQNSQKPCHQFVLSFFIHSRVLEIRSAIGTEFHISLNFGAASLAIELFCNVRPAMRTY